MATAYKLARLFAGRLALLDGSGEPIDLDSIRSIEPRDWLDPRTGRTEVGSVAFVTMDSGLAARLPVGTAGRLSVRWDGTSDAGWDDLGPMQVAYNRPKVDINEVPTYRIVFEPAGRR